MSDRERLRREAQREASTVDEFCARNHICRDTVYRQIRAGHLKAKKVGKRTLIFDEDERAWRDSLPVLAATAA
jgi:excisionase family DNA binding protein